jgi:hypothetical protein
MLFPRQDKSQLVSERGAAAGSVLCGTALTNRGLRLRVVEAQERGHGGPIRGDFVILDPGDNKHAAALQPLLGRVTNAAEVLAAIRRHYPSCVSVTNASILTVAPG